MEKKATPGLSALGKGVAKALGPLLRALGSGVAEEAEETGSGVTLEDLAAATRPLLDEGKHEEVRALLTRYNVKSLPELAESQRIDFLRELKRLREEA